MSRNITNFECVPANNRYGAICSSLRPGGVKFKGLPISTGVSFTALSLSRDYIFYPIASNSKIELETIWMEAIVT
jgi:hypothetical protein